MLQVREKVQQIRKDAATVRESAFAEQFLLKPEYDVEPPRSPGSPFSPGRLFKTKLENPAYWPGEVLAKAERDEGVEGEQEEIYNSEQRFYQHAGGAGHSHTTSSAVETNLNNLSSASKLPAWSYLTAVHDHADQGHQAVAPQHQEDHLRKQAAQETLTSEEEQRQLPVEPSSERTDCPASWNTTGGGGGVPVSIPGRLLKSFRKGVKPPEDLTYFGRKKKFKMPFQYEYRTWEEYSNRFEEQEQREFRVQLPPRVLENPKFETGKPPTLLELRGLAAPKRRAGALRGFGKGVAEESREINKSGTARRRR
ncbi:unnamed protein product [Amoebophrya sp. A120]|nr:unnamed protein product [Amoebophrya sp. A120]|eukprot:GSA120T00012760001.1